MNCNAYKSTNSHFVRNQTFKHLWNKVANFCQTTKSQVVTKFSVTEPRLHCILSLCHIVKSTQYKKLVPNVLRFIYQNLKSCKITWKNKTKNIRLLVFNFSWIDLVFWSFLFCFFTRFAIFQILICRVNRKAFGTSFFYWVDFINPVNSSQKTAVPIKQPTLEWSNWGQRPI